MEKVNLKNYAICSLLTSRVEPQFFGVERSSIENETNLRLKCFYVFQKKNDSNWYFKDKLSFCVSLPRTDLEELIITSSIIGKIGSEKIEF